MGADYAVVYDILDEGFSGKRLLIPLAWLAGLLCFVGAAVRSARRREFDALAGVCLLLAFWLCAGVFGVGNVVREQWRCMQWARSGDYQVVEGAVRDFKPMPKGGHALESFTVGGVPFCYSDYDLSRGGFNNAASHGGPIRAGLVVRIAHHDGRILRIEVSE